MQKLRRVPFGSPSTGQKTHTTHTTRREELIMTKSRKGFTLVELLIVIVVIGILSAMMMLSSTEAVTSAKASNIVSNMRNIKTAALAYYTDNMDAVRDTTYTADSVVDDVTKNGTEAIATKIVNYLNNEKDSSIVGANPAYTVVVGSGTNLDEWYVKYAITNDLGATEAARVKTKLAGRAKSVGLLAASDGQATAYTTGENVYMRVR